MCSSYCAFGLLAFHDDNKVNNKANNTSQTSVINRKCTLQRVYRLETLVRLKAMVLSSKSGKICGITLLDASSLGHFQIVLCVGYQALPSQARWDVGLDYTLLGPLEGDTWQALLSDCKVFQNTFHPFLSEQKYMYLWKLPDSVSVMASKKWLIFKHQNWAHIVAFCSEHLAGVRIHHPHVEREEQPQAAQADAKGSTQSLPLLPAPSLHSGHHISRKPTVHFYGNSEQQRISAANHKSVLQIKKLFSSL